MSIAVKKWLSEYKVRSTGYFFYSATHNKSRHQTKRSCPDSGSSDNKVITEHFPRWLVIQSKDDNRQSLDHITVFAIGKSL